MNKPAYHAAIQSKLELDMLTQSSGVDRTAGSQGFNDGLREYIHNRASSHESRTESGMNCECEVGRTP